MRQDQTQPLRSLIEELEGLCERAALVRAFRAVLSLFLRGKRVTLQNVEGISASSASRFFGRTRPAEAYWQVFNTWQRELLQQLYTRSTRPGRRKGLMLKVDMTSIEKTGRSLPWVRVFHGVFGIHVLVLHAHVGPLSFPLARRIYLGKGQTKPIRHALAMLSEWSALAALTQVTVMADADFFSRELLRACEKLGYQRVILGVAKDRRLAGGMNVAQARKGQQVQLHGWPDKQLWLSWARVKRDGAYKRFYILATFKASGAYLSYLYRQRWLIESFFQAAKHDFGLKEARLRTQHALDLWLFFSLLAFTLAAFERARHRLLPNRRYALTLLQAAANVLEALFLPWLRALALLELQRLDRLARLQQSSSYSQECKT